MNKVAVKRSKDPIILKRLHALLYSTNTNPSSQQQQQQYEGEGESIKNKTYWTKRIHSLCTQHGKVHEALLLLDNLRLHGYFPDSLNLNSIIHALCSSYRFTDAHNRLLQFINPPHSVPDERTCNVLIARLLDAKTPQQTLIVIRSLIAAKPAFVPSLINYNRLIYQFCSSNQSDEARKLFDDMKIRGHSPNSISYTTMINGFVRVGELEGFFREVYRIADDIPQGKSVKEEFAFGQMIDSLCRAGQNHGASRIVYIMRKKGFLPRLVSYNYIVHSLSNDGGCMRAYQLYKEVLVEALCQESDICKAKDLLEYMLNTEAIDRTRIYNIFLRALCSLDNPSELLNVLVSMLQNQFQPDVVTLNTIVKGLCKTKKVDEALKVLNDMLAGNLCAPDVVTFTTVISGLLNDGRTDEAFHLLRVKMPENGLKPGIVTYNAVLRGLCKLQKVNEAMGIFCDVLKDGKVFNCTTCTIMIEGLCRLYRIDEAKRFWDDVVWPSKIHDDFVYAEILKGLCGSGKFNEACDFLYELVDCGVSPNIVNYNILIDKACKLGLRTQAYQILGVRRDERELFGPRFHNIEDSG
ncbi:hypothetical protein MKX01_008856 [Papaver californicum]|nr:hypothetical protein MKX01_008856 [Papaver californicum]